MSVKHQLDCSKSDANDDDYFDDSFFTKELLSDPIIFNDLNRREIRSLIFHLLYAADAFDYQESVEAIIDNFNRGFELDIPPKGELLVTTKSIIELRNSLDEIYKPFLANWRFERLGTCTLLILRYAVWELYNSTMEQRIVINEAVELAKCFAEKDAYKFINGILDRVIKNRAGETETIE